ncbi:type VI secretion system tip protein VgrG [Vibrio sp. SCSIO 43135]|uniref:type VI secretion system tip protein TssI/VgrG n=1 Tax=Vibrio sp. SCSIO 43135 TaxID=2819096 RepID=UPI002074C430|nr:type VI secretion system tip protein TssI/VgrG [Vibrio sp. SCSIO 43135]USD39977.1 type VI secretion system tip protein VgrG [Vibrio sp. SCSIO 43135]
MATLQFDLVVEGIDSSTFVVREFTGNESVSASVSDLGESYSGFRYCVDIASRQHTIVAEDIIDKRVMLTVKRNGEPVQKTHGIVRRFDKGDTGHSYTFYSLVIVPSLERLSLRQNSRIFQQKTTQEIVSLLLSEMGIEDYAFSLKNELVQREFCVQYRETDLDFVHRLIAEEGISYYFTHDDAKHTLIFNDASETIEKLATPISYNAKAGGNADSPYISAWEASKRVEVNQASLTDYSFKKPSYSLAQTQSSETGESVSRAYQHYDYPGRYKSDDAGKLISQVRLEYLRRQGHTANGKSDQALIRAGAKFDLCDHLDAEMNRDWVAVRVLHQGKQPQALEEEAGSGATTYSNEFVAIPGDKNWQSEPQNKPLVDGPMIATVVGPEGEEIFCDEHGRVKLHFPWDRYSNGDENSSCWVRVAQGWAGSQYGMMAIPRIGHEVIVEFLNGDPDQPIVTGRTYHATNTPPYSLPDNKTRTVLRTESHQGVGFNELSFEDQAGEEQIYVHAQKDMQKLVQNDDTLHVTNDLHSSIENDVYDRVGRNSHSTIDGEQRSTVTGNQSLIVDGSLQLMSGSVWVNDSGSEIHIKSGNKVVLEAGSEITVKAAGSFLKVDPAGVHLVGGGVNLNSGGSPGVGSGFSGLLAEQPTALVPNTLSLHEEPSNAEASLESATENVITDLEPSNSSVPFSNQGGSTTSNTMSTDEGAASTSSSQDGPEDTEELTEESQRLKSSLLKQSVTLDKLANRESGSYKKGAKGEEVEYIQQALVKLGFDLGTAGADGDFGSMTEKQVKLFQGSYEPSHSTHLAYEVGAVDGIVGQGTILGLDEALVDGWVYETKCKLDIDHEFIQQLEGSKLEGYVPEPDISQSGVTIATGFDLGARSVSDLVNLGLPENLVVRFTPYLGLKRYEAMERLEANPLTITNEELTIVNEVVKKAETEKIVSVFNSSSSTTKFECLPKQAQTVIASVSYQYGYLPRRAAKFWQQAITQDWEAMYANLMDFEDQFPSRRTKEAKRIKELL